jgi:hypothetical protein
VLLHDLDLAYEMMDRRLTAVERHQALHHNLLLCCHSEMRPLPQDDRFQGIVERFRLPGYWQVYGATRWL